MFRGKIPEKNWSGNLSWITLSMERCLWSTKYSLLEFRSAVHIWRCWMSSVVLWFIFPGMVICRIQGFFPPEIHPVSFCHTSVNPWYLSDVNSTYLTLKKKRIGFTGIPSEVLQPAAKPRQRSVRKKESVHTGHGGEDQRDAELFWSEGDRPAGPSDPRGDAETQVWCSRCRKLQFLR